MAEGHSDIEIIGEDIDDCDIDYVDDECDEEVFCEDDGSKLDDDTRLFNKIVGAIEEFMMDPDFESEKDNFLEKHYTVFEDTPENKLEYMDIFQKYTAMIEGLLDARLKAVVPEFSLDSFAALLASRAAASGSAGEDEEDTLSSVIASDVVDLVASLGDFETFKEGILSYKRERDGGNALEICCSAVHIHAEEQEDGEERPDLDFSLEVSSLSPTPCGRSGAKGGAFTDGN